MKVKRFVSDSCSWNALRRLTLWKLRQNELIALCFFHKNSVNDHVLIVVVTTLTLAGRAKAPR